MEFLIVLVVLTIVVLVVSGPLRRAARAPSAAAGHGSGDDAGAAEAHERALAELEAAREAKYREIRDAELDHDTGKLSDADFEAIDRTLRGEAIEILKAIDRERAASGQEPAA